MEKVKKKLKNLPILPTFMLITIFFILLAMLLVQNEILRAIVLSNDGQIFTNWHNSAAFDKTGSIADK